MARWRGSALAIDGPPVVRGNPTTTLRVVPLPVPGRMTMRNVSPFPSLPRRGQEQASGRRGSMPRRTFGLKHPVSHKRADARTHPQPLPCGEESHKLGTSPCPWS